MQRGSSKLVDRIDLTPQPFDIMPSCTFGDMLKDTQSIDFNGNCNPLLIASCNLAERHPEFECVFPAERKELKTFFLNHAGINDCLMIHVYDPLSIYLVDLFFFPPESLPASSTFIIKGLHRKRNGYLF